MSAVETPQATDTAAAVLRGTPLAIKLPDGDETLNRTEVARRLGISERQVDYLVKSKRIPHMRLGSKCIRFSWRSILGGVQ